MILWASIIIIMCIATQATSLKYFDTASRPLEPWLNKSTITFPENCVVIDAWGAGLGSQLSFLWWAMIILKQVKPDMILYYQHKSSAYQCWSNSSLNAFLLPRDDLVILSEENSVPPAGCAHWETYTAVKFIRQYLLYEWNSNPPHGKVKDGIHETNINSPALERAIHQSRCQVINSFWNVVPNLRQSIEKTRKELYGDNVVVVLRARGGDKFSEMSGETDEMGRYHMEPGIKRLIDRYGNQLNKPLCVVFGDEPDYVDAVGSLANRTLNCSKVIIRTESSNKAGHSQFAFNKLSSSERCDLANGLIVDFELMAAANYFVGIPRSNLDNVVFGLRKCIYYHDDNTAIDGNGRPKFGIWV